MTQFLIPSLRAVAVKTKNNVFQQIPARIHETINLERLQ
jgi:hypothetical protein